MNPWSHSELCLPDRLQSLLRLRSPLLRLCMPSRLKFPRCLLSLIMWHKRHAELSIQIWSTELMPRTQLSPANDQALAYAVVMNWLLVEGGSGLLGAGLILDRCRLLGFQTGRW